MTARNAPAVAVTLSPLDNRALANLTGPLDANLRLTERGNHEILAAWLCLAAASGYQGVFPRIREVLSRVGRMKYVRPLYQALGRSEAGRKVARELFERVAPTYHALTRRVAEGVIQKYPA